VVWARVRLIAMSPSCSQAQRIYVRLVYCPLQCADLGDRVEPLLLLNLRHLYNGSRILVEFVKHLPMPIRAVWWVLGWLMNLWRRFVYVWKLGAADEGKMDIRLYFGSFISFYVHVNVTTILGVLSGGLIPGMKWRGLEIRNGGDPLLVFITPYLKRRPFCLHANAGVASVAFYLACPIILAACVGGDRRAVGYFADYSASNKKKSQKAIKYGGRKNEFNRCCID